MKQEKLFHCQVIETVKYWTLWAFTIAAYATAAAVFWWSGTAYGQEHDPRQWVEVQIAGQNETLTRLPNQGGGSTYHGLNYNGGNDWTLSVGEGTESFPFGYYFNSSTGYNSNDIESVDLFEGLIDLNVSVQGVVIDIVNWGPPYEEPEGDQPRAWVRVKITGSNSVGGSDWPGNDYATLKLPNRVNGSGANYGNNDPANPSSFDWIYLDHNGSSISAGHANSPHGKRFSGNPAPLYEGVLPDDIGTPESLEIQVLEWGPAWVDEDGDGEADDQGDPPPDDPDTDGDGEPDSTDDDDDGDGVPDDEDADPTDPDNTDEKEPEPCDWEAIQATLEENVPSLEGVSSDVPPVFRATLFGADQLIGDVEIDLGVSNAVNTYRVLFRWFLVFLLGYAYYNLMIKDTKEL